MSAMHLDHLPSLICLHSCHTDTCGVSSPVQLVRGLTGIGQQSVSLCRSKSVSKVDRFHCIELALQFAKLFVQYSCRQCWTTLSYLLCCIIAIFTQVKMIVVHSVLSAIYQKLKYTPLIHCIPRSKCISTILKVTSHPIHTL